MKIELKFIFPKKTSFVKFDYIGANYILDWKETSNEYLLSVKTVEECRVEFYREIDRTLGLLFDNDAVIDIIDDIYARITGFTGYLLFNSNMKESEEELEDSDYEDLEIFSSDVKVIDGKVICEGFCGTLRYLTPIGEKDFTPTQSITQTH